MDRIPRTIDEPPYFLFWRLDDLVLPITGIFIGIIVELAVICGALGLVASFLYRRYREGRPEQHVLHMIYWLGLWPNRGYSLRNPFIRRYLP